MALSAREWLRRIHALPMPAKFRIMNVCGGHERAITMAGLRSALPESLELIPGPGCPVCVCPEEDIYSAIEIAIHHRVTVVSFGDMLRVPVNAPRQEVRSLEQARAAGADVRAIASPAAAVQIARQNPDREVVFFAAGFETTAAPVAAAIREGLPSNLSILLAARLTWPAVAMLLQGDTPGFDALIAPGHVATVMGPEEWNFVVGRYGLPAAVAGFSSESLLAGIYSVLRQHAEKRFFLDNCYGQVVHTGGNPQARQLLNETFEVYDANWRGIGPIPASGFRIAREYLDCDTRKRFPKTGDHVRRRAGAMPSGCDCAKVVLGRIYPPACRLYGSACTPQTPVGPCMVSDEGACRIWWSGGVKTKRSGTRTV